jgi:hypothetical protein
MALLNFVFTIRNNLKVEIENMQYHFYSTRSYFYKNNREVCLYIPLFTEAYLSYTVGVL